MDFGRISRRHLLQGSAALTLGTALGARSLKMIKMQGGVFGAVATSGALIGALS
jgi:hypothetical protein